MDTRMTAEERTEILGQDFLEEVNTAILAAEREAFNAGFRVALLEGAPGECGPDEAHRRWKQEATVPTRAELEGVELRAEAAKKPGLTEFVAELRKAGGYPIGRDMPLVLAAADVLEYLNAWLANDSLNDVRLAKSQRAIVNRIAAKTLGNSTLEDKDAKPTEPT